MVIAKLKWKQNPMIIGYCTSGVNRGVMKYTSFLYFNDIKSATDAESGTCFVPVFLIHLEDTLCDPVLSVWKASKWQKSS